MSSLDDDINRKIDNGLKRKELEEKYGGDSSSEGNLPSELESNEHVLCNDSKNAF